MSIVQQLVGKHVEIEVSGNNCFTGVLLELGSDISIIFNGRQFICIPNLHVQRQQLASLPKEGIQVPAETPFDLKSPSFRNLLNEMRGQFVELYVCGDAAIHGYITSVMNDYFVFHSPVHKKMFISMHHVKWLIPYQEASTPYSLNPESFPVSSTPITLTRSFKEQLKKLEGSLIILDLGDKPNKVGLVQSVDNHSVELVQASGDKIYWNIQHLKAVCLA